MLMGNATCRRNYRADLGFDYGTNIRFGANIYGGAAFDRQLAIAIKAADVFFGKDQFSAQSDFGLFHKTGFKG